MATSAGQSGNRDTGVNPVFVRERDIPRANVTKVSVLEVCLAAERVWVPALLSVRNGFDFNGESTQRRGRPVTHCLSEVLYFAKWP